MATTLILGLGSALLVGMLAVALFLAEHAR
jgi:hypothetical protein